MRIAELMEALEDLMDTHGEDLEVRIATQPEYPFEYSIDEVQLVELEGATVAYISTKDQLGYLPGQAARELGWKE